MKIYNKRGFFSGLFYLFMSVMALILMVYKGMNIRDWLIVVLGLILGIHYITRSLSKNASAEDRDELHELVRIKAQALAFFWTKAVCIGLFAFFAMLFSHTKSEIYLFLFIAFSFMLLGMVIVEAITEHYCNHKVD